MVKAPKLEATGFGWLLADGQRYDKDVMITAEGEIKPRPKELSKKYSRGDALSRRLPASAGNKGDALKLSITKVLALMRESASGHTPLGPEEVEIALEGNPEVLVVGMGQFGVLPILPETKEMVAQRGVELRTARMPQAIETYRRLVGEGRRVAAILHLTC